MKATFNSNSKPVSIEALGEEWKQNDLLRGQLHGIDQLKKPRISLVHASFKDVENNKKFSLIEEYQGESLNRFQFKLSESAPITDKLGSLYLLLQDGDVTIGHLQLRVLPHYIINAFLETSALFFRFKGSEAKLKKSNFIEYKLTPPASRELAHVDSLILLVKMEHKILKLEYIFSTKSLAMNAANEPTLTKKTKNILQEISSNDYEICAGSSNPDGLKKHFKEALDSIAPKMLF